MHSSTLLIIAGNEQTRDKGGGGRNVENRKL